MSFTPDYEFDNSQNNLFRDLAKKMKYVGILSQIGGVLSLVIGIIVAIVWLFIQKEEVPIGSGISGIIQGIILLLIGRWNVRAAGGFQLIVKTSGKDIDNLMHAMSQLRKLYTLQYGLAIFALVVIGIAAVISILAIIASLGN